LEDGNLFLRLWKISHTSACANEIIPSINRSFVYKAKEGRHVRILKLIVNETPRDMTMAKFLNLYRKHFYEQSIGQGSQSLYTNILAI